MYLTDNLNAQDSLSKKLKQVTILAKKSSETLASKQKIDSLLLTQYQTNNLQQLLQLHSNVFVKNYGISTLSTISIRGSSAAQTSVNWHGVNINQASTGITDFNSIPTGLFDGIHINYGNQSQSSQISGSIDLVGQSAKFSKYSQFQASIGFESLFNTAALLKYEKANTKFSNQTKLFTSYGLNSYEFYNPETQQLEWLEHAKQYQFGCINDFAFKLNARNVISMHTWLQTQARQIPAASFELSSAKSENMIALRNVIQSETKLSKKLKLHFQTAQIIDDYSYEDSLYNISARTKSIQLSTELNLTLKPGRKQSINLFVKANHSQLLNIVDKNLQQSTLGIQHTYNFGEQHLSLSTNFQYQVTNVFDVPLQAKTLLTWQPRQSIQFYSSASKAVRLPTLNELYFTPGGNANLLPEKSINYEAGLHHQTNFGRFASNLDANIFHRSVNDWIVWFGNAILTPRNIQEVRSKGLDLIWHGKYAFGVNRNYALTGGAFYAYTISTTASSAIPNDYSIGKQIPYVPRYQAKGKLGFSYKNSNIELWQTYTGYRFVTTDESQYLLPYYTTNILGSTPLDKEAHFVLNVKLNNIFNSYCEGVIGRIMPRRNFSLGLNYRLNSQ
jgi:iron complex outermembrane receptor protein